MASAARKRETVALLSSGAEKLGRLSGEAIRSSVPLIAEAKRGLSKDLAAWLASGHGADKFTAQRYRAAIIQLHLMSKKASRWPGWLLSFREKVESWLSRFGLASGRMGIEEMISEYVRFSLAFEGIAVAPAIDVVETLGRKMLLERFRNSAARYAGNIREDIRRELRISALRGETYFEMGQRLRKMGGPRGLVALRGQIGEPGAIVEDISEGLFKRYGYWSQRLVRTEMTAAYNDSHAAALEEAAKDDEDLRQMWDGAQDSRLCPICRGLDRQVVDVGETFGGGYDRPPAHPSCLLPGTRIGARLLGGLMAWYDGPAIEIKTMRGLRLCVTPNHPVATSHGFRAAGRIREGEHVLTDCGDIWHRSLGQVDEQETPPKIEQIFRALTMYGPSTFATASNDDLHGDARFCQSDIHVIGADRKLLGDIASFMVQIIGNFILPATNALQTQHGGFCAQDFFFKRMFTATRRGPSRTTLTLDALSVLFQLAPFNRLCFGLPAQGNAQANEPSTEDASTDASLIGKLKERLAGLVAFDQVIQVRNFNFSGQVYDLQTETGWMVAQGIYVSNCRCVLIPYKDRWGGERHEV